MRPHKAILVWGTIGATLYEFKFPTIKAAVSFAQTICSAFELSKDFSELKNHRCTAVGHESSTYFVKVYKVRG